MPPQAEEEGAILTTGTFREEKTLWWLEMESRTLGEKMRRSRRRQATLGAQEEPEPEVHWARELLPQSEQISTDEKKALQGGA
ncbi:hypothetical protein E2320_022006 [Naja naja]|nr:hypothetical protein E2320_022006 [Naja naja]